MSEIKHAPYDGESPMDGSIGSSDGVGIHRQRYRGVVITIGKTQHFVPIGHMPLRTRFWFWYHFTGIRIREWAKRHAA